MNNDSPIGVFDSGVGGLSVLREIRRELPNEALLYVADTRHVPYGDKPDDYIRERARSVAQFCAGQGAKALVVACNTATAVAVADLRQEFAIPVIAMEPAVKPAVAATRTGVVGVLATTGTLASARFAALLARFGTDTRVVTQPCPGLVECVERGALDDAESEALVRSYVEPLLAAGADTLILGCTHYAFLAPLIRRAAGPEITLIDTGRAVAKQLRRTLETHALLAAPRQPAAPAERFWTTGSATAFDRVLPTLWSSTPVRAQELQDAVPTA